MRSIRPPFFILHFALLLSCTGEHVPEQETVTEVYPEERVLEGRTLSLQHCTSCHLYPEPGTLDRTTWRDHVLPKMGRFFGFYELEIPRTALLDAVINREAALQQQIFPVSRKLDPEEWESIRAFYLSEAPEDLLDPPSEPAQYDTLQGFEIIKPDFGSGRTPTTTLISMDPERNVVYVGNGTESAGAFSILDSSLKPLGSRGTPSAPVHISRSGDLLYTTLIGTLLVGVRDNPPGELLQLRHDTQQNIFEEIGRFPQPLTRPIQTEAADLTGNGLEDLLIAEFGYYTGSLTLFRNLGEGEGYSLTRLRSLTGPLRFYLRDLNGDALLDIIALFGQGDEGIFLFHNEGDGQFREENLLRFNPAWGSVHFELVDWNGDGHPDILYCNGDNGDYPPVLKPYHGIRIYENDGSNGFREAWFHPMHGAYKCSAADFSRDGSQDIVAISHFPDFDAPQRQDFLYLKHHGEYEFTPYVLGGGLKERWITFDIGDLTGNGLPDILLGAYFTIEDPFNIHGSSAGDAEERRVEQSDAHSLILLRNTGESLP